MIKHWSRTQAGIALSSGEAELVALIKASSETLGLANMSGEMGEVVKVQVLTDSSAAKGAVQRVGSGRMKHISTQNLWIQEKSQRGEITYKKVARAHNYSDIMTHHWELRVGEQMLRDMGMVGSEEEFAK